MMLLTRVMLLITIVKLANPSTIGTGVTSPPFGFIRLVRPVAKKTPQLMYTKWMT